ncbi:MAG TPA: methylmalonyl-CoA mutase family protein [Chitinophagaceae bacterium]|nr:methylmalonyl-CoA mutase family protein [Chitinophagaceae bacterium]
MDKRKFTDSGIEIKPLYTDPVPMEELPGIFPFTRGIHPGMYRDRLWTMRQYAGFSTAAESNRRYHYLISQGVTGLSVAFDLPTQIGYDSDHPLAEGEVGKVGVAIDSLEDMETLMLGIDPEKISVSMTINATAFILLALYVAAAKKKGAVIGNLSGTVQNDILKEYAARGTFIYPPRPSLRLVTDLMDYCSRSVPKWNTISVSGYHIREAGSTAVQELAFTLANGKAYLEAARDAGLDINLIAQRVSFFFNAHNNLFAEVAKFRAGRRIWARITRGLGVTDPKGQMLRFHTQTGGSTLTAAQPMNNIVRVTLQSLSAVLGGTQSLHTNGYDEALSLPSEQAATIALRTQQILALESGVPDTVDPLAGSFFVETLTGETEKNTLELLDRIDSMGGAVRAIESQFMQQEIAKSAYSHQQQVERKEKIIVGVNRFFSQDNQQPEIQQPAGEIARAARERLAALKGRRDPESVAGCLGRIAKVAATGENLMPEVIGAVEHYCTLGEISDALRQVWGEYRQ